FAHRIVERTADNLIIEPRFHKDEIGVSACDAEREHGKRGRGNGKRFAVVFRERREDVAFQMVRGDKRLVPGERERFCEIDAHPESRFEPGTCSDGDRVYVRRLRFLNEFEECFGKPGFAFKEFCEAVMKIFGNGLRVFMEKLGFFERRFKERYEIFGVLALCERREDAAVFLMDIYLREKGVAEDLEFGALVVSGCFDYRDRGFIARGFDCKNPHWPSGASFSTIFQGSGEPQSILNPALFGWPLPPYFCAISATFTVPSPRMEMPIPSGCADT